VPAGSALTMDGFGFDVVAKKPAKGVDLDVDGRLFGTTYGSPRADVATAQKVPDLVKVGYRGVIPGAILTPGEHQVSVRVVSADGTGFYASPVIKFTAR
jgi:hypothetical protein